jgi:RNA polymerase sigma-70 factor (ECF subfamily)
MTETALLEKARSEGWTDEEIVARVLNGEVAAFEIIMRRYNQRLYRTARAILRDDAEAEDVMQDAYVRAYQHLRQFAGRARFSTWLTRIAVHEALARLRRRARFEPLESSNGHGENMNLESYTPTPEQQAASAQVNSMLEAAILTLPETYRTILMLRDIEELNTAETAECLDITEENVKVRLHRARALLRKELYARAGSQSSSAFTFMGVRCDRVVHAVMERLNCLEPHHLATC